MLLDECRVYKTSFVVGRITITYSRTLAHTCNRSLITLVPRPHPKNRERGLVSLAKIPICAESAYYATHPDNHIPYIIDLLRLSHASALRNVELAMECYNWQ